MCVTESLPSCLFVNCLIWGILCSDRPAVVSFEVVISADIQSELNASIWSPRYDLIILK